jgi:hypothetical protein
MVGYVGDLKVAVIAPRDGLRQGGGTSSGKFSPAEFDGRFSVSAGAGNRAGAGGGDFNRTADRAGHHAER